MHMGGFIAHVQYNSTSLIMMEGIIIRGPHTGAIVMTHVCLMHPSVRTNVPDDDPFEFVSMEIFELRG